MTPIDANTLVILGAGESGVGAALLAKARGIPVFVSEYGSIAAPFRAELEAAGIAFEAGGHSQDQLLLAGEVVKSPGIPDEAPVVQALLAKGIPVISEIEFAARYTSATLIGITGSNGKTTTAMLTHHLLVSAGLNARLAGNVGDGFARSVAVDTPPDIYVLELSSFQLDGIRDFRAPAAALLNITPDHLDRYGYELDNYAAAKFRIAMNQQPGDVFFYFAEDPHTSSRLGHFPIRARQQPISLTDIAGDQVKCGDLVFDLGPTQLRGKHNALNALFALHLARWAGANPTLLQQGLQTFQPAPHRLELVGEIDGVTYLNDSKATNVDAVYYALDAMRQPLVWIAGGQDKGNDYSPLLPLVHEKVHSLVCLGVDNEKLKATFQGLVTHLVEVGSAAEAVAAARSLARPGDTVLLSPACASFDLFRNYLDRGDQFRAAVQQLLHTHPA